MSGREHKWYGAFIDLKHRPCLVVGGGPVAERKITGLLDCGADVTVIAPTVTESIAEAVRNGTIQWQQRTYREGDAAPYVLIIAATRSQEVNRLVHEDAERHQRLVNVVNDQTLGNLQVPAVVRRGKLQIAVSTQGASPAAAKRIRQELEQQFGEEYAVYLEWMAEIRRTLLAQVGEEARRTQIFQAIAGSDLLGLLREGRHADAKQLIADYMEGHQ